MALASLCLFALSLASPLAGGGKAPPRARLEVLEGRAALATGADVRSIRPEHGALDALAPSYLETGALSRSSLRFGGTASVALFGASACEWGAGTSRAVLDWRMHSFDEVHLEVRRGPVSVHLPGGWCALVESAAVYLAARPGGGFLLQHDAGLPILLARPSERGRVRPPLTVLAGARLRFDGGAEPPRASGASAARLLDPFGRPESSALETPRGAPPWASFCWPWRDPAPAPLP